MSAPKKFWHPTLIIVDEAHLFAPEKGKSEASSAVIVASAVPAPENLRIGG